MKRMLVGRNLNKRILISGECFSFCDLSSPHNSCSVIELFWSSHTPGSLVSAINNISEVLGVPHNPISFSPGVNRVHAGKNNRNTSVSAEEKSDQIYRTMMNLETNPYFRLHLEPAAP
jgi:hypothetical protein